VRVPDGSSLRVDTGGDGIQRIHDSDGALVSASRWGRSGPEPVAVRQASHHLTLRPAPSLGESAVRAMQHYLGGIALYGQLVQGLVRGAGQPVISFRAREFVGSRAKGEALVFVGEVSETEIEQACPRYPEVRTMTNEVTAERRPMYGGRPQDLGTAVHVEIKRLVNDKRDENFRAEESVVKSVQEYGEAARRRYGAFDTLRVDVYEKLANDTVCVYDIKTGKSGLTPARTAEIAAAVYRLFEFSRRFLIIEVRPD
jgi:hypothetical protein